MKPLLLASLKSLQKTGQSCATRIFLLPGNVWSDLCPVCHTVTAIDKGLLFVPGNIVYSFQRGWDGQVAPTSGAIEF
jgi:hypothetical protein